MPSPLSDYDDLVTLLFGNGTLVVKLLDDPIAVYFCHSSLFWVTQYMIYITVTVTETTWIWNRD